MANYAESVDSCMDEIYHLATTSDGWKNETTKNDVLIHQRSSDDSPIVMMRGFLHFNCGADDVLKGTEDLSVRSKWDELFIEGNIVENIDDNHQVLHFKFKSPAMMVSARDFVMARGVQRRDDGTIISNHVNAEHPNVPEQKGYVRGEIRASGYVIVPKGDGCDVTYMVQIDPKGWIPSAVVNMVATKQPLVLAKLKKYLNA